MATSASSSAAAATSATSDLDTASAIMASSTPSPVLTTDDITRIVNKHVNAVLIVAASTVTVRAFPHGLKLKMFSGISKECLD